jgi:hypothetical protein
VKAACSSAQLISAESFHRTPSEATMRIRLAIVPIQA